MKIIANCWTCVLFRRKRAAPASASLTQTPLAWVQQRISPNSHTSNRLALKAALNHNATRLAFIQANALFFRSQSRDRHFPHFAENIEYFFSTDIQTKIIQYQRRRNWIRWIDFRRLGRGSDCGRGSHSRMPTGNGSKLWWPMCLHTTHPSLGQRARIE